MLLLALGKSIESSRDLGLRMLEHYYYFLP